MPPLCIDTGVLQLPRQFFTLFKKVTNAATDASSTRRDVSVIQVPIRGSKEIKAILEFVTATMQTFLGSKREIGKAAQIRLRRLGFQLSAAVVGGFSEQLLDPSSYAPQSIFFIIFTRLSGSTLLRRSARSRRHTPALVEELLSDDYDEARGLI